MKGLKVCLQRDYGGSFDEVLCAPIDLCKNDKTLSSRGGILMDRQAGGAASGAYQGGIKRMFSRNANSSKRVTIWLLQLKPNKQEPHKND